MTKEGYINHPVPNKTELLNVFNQNDNLIIFDIGSCEGLDSIRYKKLFPNSKVYSIEPLKNNINYLVEYVSKNKIEDIYPINTCFSDKEEEVIFYESYGHPSTLPKSNNWDYGNKSSSLIKPYKHLEYHNWVQFKETKVNTITLDKFCIENYITNIDFIHMDVQGAELKVLNGGLDILKTVKCIWLEVEVEELYKDQPLKNDIESFMLKNNFNKIKDTTDNVSGDQFWVSL